MSNVSRSNTSAGEGPDQNTSSTLPMDKSQTFPHNEANVEDSAFAKSSIGYDLSASHIPYLFTSSPPIQDQLATETSFAQEETIQECLPFLIGTNDPEKSPFDFNAYGIPRLEREKHIEFLRDSLEEMPSTFLAYDASRPWIVYWALTGLGLLGMDISEYRQRVIQTFRAAQNPDGGFGGGHMQLSHCAPSYTAILCISMIGEADAFDLIDRRALWHWLGQLKQADGSFAMTRGGEVDVRGAYCALVMISLLCLPLELPKDAPAREHGKTSFLDDLPLWLSRCQTYEGGISASPGTEAHGAYAFLAIACFCFLGSPREILPRYLDCDSLTSWMSARQYAPEGGFAGRTNKLVDACYSHWIGGCWPLIESAMELHSPVTDDTQASSFQELYSREGIVRYILCCCQADGGGLRDKPSKRPDGYHSCYALAGLSSAQNRSQFNAGAETVSDPLGSAFAWSHEKDLQGRDKRDESKQICQSEDMVEPVHPIFVIPYAAVRQTRAFFLARSGF
ncbi:CAAX farnesyltransferase (FTase) subunit beta [Lambiella insularis]|nr:CAAX farnesyltransferase (FTase) subunit beta [Lambiella insularis]